MSQRQQIERIFFIDRQIRRGRFPSAEQLATELEVSRRVIFTDRKFMVERLSAPIANDRKRGGWHYTDATWMLPSTMISEGELLAFVLGTEAARGAAGTALKGPLSSAVEKIARSLHGPVEVDLHSLQQHCAFSTLPAVATEAPTLLGLHTAMQSNHRVRIDYYSPERDEHTRRTLDPYGLHHTQGNWYLIAYDHLRQAMRNFHIGRISHWEALSQSFERNSEFDVAQWIGEMLGAERGEDVREVVIRFDAYQARYIRERQWHPTQQIEELPDDGLILSFQTSSWGEVVRFVLQYGSHAEVLAPQELWEEVAEEVQQMNRYYEPRESYGCVVGSRMSEES